MQDADKGYTQIFAGNWTLPLSGLKREHILFDADGKQFQLYVKPVKNNLAADDWPGGNVTMTLTGDLELPAVQGEPRVFVLTGNGTGTGVFRRLQREGIPFAAGILWENDLDYPSAKALAAEVVSEKAFTTFSEVHMERAKQLIDNCEQVICTLDTENLGSLGEGLRELKEYALKLGKL